MAERKRVIVDIISNQEEENTEVLVENLYIKSRDNVEENKLTQEEKAAIVRELNQDELRLLECILDVQDNIISCTANDMLIALMRNCFDLDEKEKLRSDILNLIDSTLEEIF